MSEAEDINIPGIDIAEDLPITEAKPKEEEEVKRYTVSSGAELLLTAPEEQFSKEQKTKFLDEVERISDNLSKFPSDLEKVKTIHEGIDIYATAHTKDKPIACRMGCSHCCHTPVVVSNEEVDILIEEIEKGIDVDKEKLKEQAKHATDSKWWLTQPKENTRCVLLDSESGMCKVYHKRPSACRIHFVTSEPEHCIVEDKKDGESKLKKYVVPSAEVLTSALYQASSRVDQLSKLLLERLK